MEKNIINKSLLTDDPDIVISLYKRYWKILYTSALKVLKDKEACEDIVQDIFLNIWTRRNELQINVSIEAYLLTAVKYEVYRRIKESRKYQQVSVEATEICSELLSSDAVAQNDYIQEVSAIVNTLPPKCREVYLLSRGQQLSHKEISDRLSISINTVRNHLTRALRQLRLDLLEMILLTISLFFIK